MCLHYLVKLIARVLSPYITYFSIRIQVVDFWHQFFTNLKQQFSTVNDGFHSVYCYTLYIVCRLIIWLLIKFAVTVFNVLWLFQSHAAIVKCYNTFCVNLMQTVTPNKISSATQHFLYMLANIFTFNELWNITFCHKTRRVCNVRWQNSCYEFYKVV